MDFMSRSNKLNRIPVLALVGCVWGFGCTGCICVDWVTRYGLDGTMLDLESGEPLAGVAISANFFRDGQPVEGRVSETSIPNESLDGGFGVSIAQDSGGWCGPIGYLIPNNRPTELEIPDQVELVVRRDECEVRVLIDLNAETLAYDGPGNGRRFLSNPVLVPGCP